MPPVVETGATSGGRVRGQQVVPINTAPDELARTPRGANVYIETFPLSSEFAIAEENVRWTNLSQPIDGKDETLTLEVSLDSARLAFDDPRRQHFAELAALLHPDKRVRLAVPRGNDPPLVLFQGWPQTRTIHWSPDGQSFVVQCLSEIQERLRGDLNGQVIGRQMRRNPAIDPADDSHERFSALHRVDALPAIFNADGKPNRLVSYRNVPQNLMIKRTADATEDEVWVFADDDAPEAGYWNFAAALRYVAILFLEPVGVDVADFLADTAELHNLEPNSGDPDPFRRRMRGRCEKVPIPSTNADEALRVLCEAVELHYWFALTQDVTGLPRWRLVIAAQVRSEAEETATRERAMGAPVIGLIPRDEPYADYSGLQPADIAARNEARTAHLSIDSRVAPTALFLGGVQHREVTLLLRPGWRPHPRLDNLTTEAEVDAAITFWEDQLGFIDEVIDEETKRPFSPYHTAHPQHYRKIREFDPSLEPGENPLAGEAPHPNDDTFAMIGRLWVFPDNLDYVSIDGATSEYMRSSGPWNDAKFWRPFLEWPLPANGQPKHILSHEALGGGEFIWDLNTAVLRRRLLLNTIGRAHQATTDRAPIVRFNFTATDPMTALADPNWIQVDGVATIDKTRAALWINAANLANDPRLRADAEDEATSLIQSYLGVPLDATADPAIRPRFFVAITCTIGADHRMQVTPGSNLPFITRTTQGLVDTGLKQFTHRLRSQGSHLKAAGLAETDPEFKPRDDFEQLTAYGNREIERIGRETVAGNFEAPYIKTDVLRGDGFSGIAGLGITFSSFPMVVGIEMTNDPKAGLRTKFILSDERHDMDAGMEV